MKKLFLYLLINLIFISYSLANNSQELDEITRKNEAALKFLDNQAFISAVKSLDYWVVLDYLETNSITPEQRKELLSIVEEIVATEKTKNPKTRTILNNLKLVFGGLMLTMSLYVLHENFNIKTFGLENKDREVKFFDLDSFPRPVISKVFKDVRAWNTKVCQNNHNPNNGSICPLCLNLNPLVDIYVNISNVPLVALSGAGLILGIHQIYNAILNLNKTHSNRYLKALAIVNALKQASISTP